MKTNWFKVASLIFVGVIIGYSVATFMPKPPVDITPVCLDWVNAIIANQP